ncbi:Alpha/Beta hydrolase protein [Dactylonectria estremocensis]|uniref:alcohol O-acetyltransferase n=1 Tax=Dactylonectria estremocensis TaxID=1079267 RepID=A0A9P9F0I9_9HYPO|nr:Alpha/Beta hydrolase protein [Dactylonectria estremocensis]
MEWFGQAEINFTHAPSPRTIREKDGTETDLLKICEQVTPPCNLNPLLFNGHLQTMWTATRPAGPKIYYKRKIFEADHEMYHGTFAVDFVVDPHDSVDSDLGRRTIYYTDDELQNMGSDDNKPMLVVLHGLSGGSHEVYLRHAIAPLVGEGGWEACVVNFRGCARSKITSGVLYNARATWDVRQTIKWLTEEYPNRPLFGLGFSLGANMLTNYCGEEGANCVLKAAVACSNPFNLEVSSKMLQSNYFSREVYLRIMGSSLKDLARTHRAELEKYSNVDVESVLEITYLNEFDRLIQCPTWGYPTEYAYYRDASSTDAVLSIQIPFLAINSTDDPIAIKDAIPFEEFELNPNTVLLTTSLGGHLCWFEIGGGRWFTRPLANFLNHLAFKTDLDNLAPKEGAADASAATAGHGYVPMRRKMMILKQ